MLATLDTPEPDMASRRIDRLRHACRRAVTPAIIRGAQMRPAFYHLAWNPDVRHLRIAASFPGPATRILHGAAAAVDLPTFLIPVGRPLPDIARHIVKPVAICRK